MQAHGLEQFSGKFGVIAALHAPKPEAFLIPLEQLQGLLEPLHSRIERRNEEKYRKGPALSKTRLNTHGILPVLVDFNAAAVLVPLARLFVTHIVPQFPRIVIL